MRQTMAAESGYSRLILLAAIIVSLGRLGAARAGDAIAYVDADAPPGGNGVSWETAVNDLQTAFNFVDPTGTGATIYGQIWVAEGTYLPTIVFEGSPRETSFVLPKNCLILGGFAGNETSAEERDPVAHPTILSGDIGIPGNPADNSRRIIRLFSGNNSNNTHLDGFTITLGRADGNVQRGGAIHGDNGGAMIRHCRFVDNRADLEGAAIYSTSAIVMEHCEFIDNAITLLGGNSYAVSVAGGSATDCLFMNNIRGGVRNVFTIRDCVFDNTSGGVAAAQVLGSAIDCVFVNNIAETGASGLGVLASPLVSRCLFLGNSGSGGALSIAAGTAGVVTHCTFLGNTSSAASGGAIRHIGSGHLRVLNSVFSGNFAPVGGAIWQGGFAGPMTIANCTISNNSATSQTAGVLMFGTGSIRNSILWGNSVNAMANETAQIASDSGSPSIEYSCVQGWTGSLGGVGNFGVNPDFLNALGSDFIAGTADDDLRLSESSPAIDAADNAAAPIDYADLDGDGNTGEFVPIDILGNSRFFDAPTVPDTGSGIAPIIDMGAIEFDGSGVPPSPGTYIGPSGGSWFVASNWAGGAVPNAEIDVVITSTVIIDQQGAIAKSVSIGNRGILLITDGVLSVVTVTSVKSGAGLTLSGSGSGAALNTLIVERGGTLTLDNPTAVLTASSMATQTGSILAWNSGVVSVGPGAWASAAPINIGCVGDSELRLLAGSVNSPHVTLCAFGSLTGNGTINGPIDNGGRVAPGSSIGLITINGSYTQMAAGVLDIETLDFTPTGYDRLIVSNQAVVGGTLNVITLPGFHPTLAGDQRFVIGGSQSGTFATLNLSSLPNGFAFSVQYQVLMPDQNHQAVRLRTSLSASGARLYVDATAAPGGAGQSWADASNDLRGAVEQAALLAAQIQEIWVAAGTYRPDGGTGERTFAFLLGPGLSMYGGFAGFESDPGDRNIESNPSILSGDLLGNDGEPGTFVNNTENSYNVVKTVCNGCPNPPRLDGFTITGGNANLPDNSNYQIGGGLRGDADGQVIINCRFVGNFATNSGGGARVAANSVLHNCEFTSNATSIEAGALHVGGGAPQITNCVFDGNASGSSAGVTVTEVTNAMFDECVFANHVGDSCIRVLGNRFFATTISNCQFTSNQTTSVIDGRPNSTIFLYSCSIVGNNGRALNNIGTTTLNDCLMSGNTRGGIRSSGSINGVINLVANNCSFIDNSVTNEGISLGGALNTSGGSILTDCLFANNSALESGGAIYNGGYTILRDCTFTGNSASQGSAIYNYRYATLYGGANLLGDDELYNTGNLFPGESGSHGAFVIAGSFQHVHTVPPGSFSGLFPGVLHMSLGGATPGSQHDVIDAGKGDVTLQGGLLQVDLQDGYQPKLGEAFHIIRAHSCTGAFSVASMPALPSGLFLNVAYGDKGVNISVDELETLIAFVPGEGVPLSAIPVDGQAFDIDGDTDLDVVLLLPGATPGTPGEVVVLRNLGVDFLGNWLGFDSRVSITPVAADPKDMVIASLDADGSPDVAVACANSGVTILLNSGDGTGTLSFHSTLAAGVASVRIASFLRKREVASDLVVIQFGGAQYYRNDGKAGFTFAQGMSGSVTAQLIALGDMDGDLDADLATIRYQAFSNDPAILELRKFDSETNTFGSGVNYQVGPRPTGCILADLNLDNLVDVITADTSSGGLSIGLTGANQLVGTLAISEPIRLPVGVQPRSLVSSDFDLDGDLDLAFIVNAQGTTEPRVQILRNDLFEGQLAFATAIETAAGTDTRLLFAGDINLSGKPDLLAVNTSDAFAQGVAISLDSLVDTRPTIECPSDTNGDGVVNVADLLAVIGAWGACVSCPKTPCPADVNGDCSVNVADLLAVIGGWGACP